MEIKKRLSTKEVCGNLAAPQKPVAVMHVYGLAVGCETITTAYGDSVKFKGEFEAINVENGEVFRAPVCYLPSIAETMLQVALAQSNGGVQFGFEIGIKPHDSQKYEYTCTPLIKPDEKDDPLLKMRQMALEHKPDAKAKGK